MARTSPTAEIDRVITQSKRITEDLMILRRELKDVVACAALDKRMSHANDRLSLVLDDLHALSETLYKMWEEMTDVRRAKYATLDAARMALGDGQLRLIAGERR
jgi:hypothetical protein